jgi:molybdopterin-guanine dinucleotide biosynthesis protein B
VSAHYHRTRASAEAQLGGEIARALACGQRLLVGCDFPFGYPAGFARALLGNPGAGASDIWRYLGAHIQDGPDNANNRFDVAAQINRHFIAGQAGHGPFWGRPMGRDLPDLPARKWVDYTAFSFAERRAIDRAAPKAQPVWKLYTTGSVGGQALMGLPMIARLAQQAGGAGAVWPFHPIANANIILAEVYPSLLAQKVAQIMGQIGPSAIKDQVQVQVLSAALYGQSGDIWAQMLAPPHPDAAEEGWILGLGFTDALLAGG